VVSASLEIELQTVQQDEHTCYNILESCRSVSTMVETKIMQNGKVKLLHTGNFKRSYVCDEFNEICLKKL
jgi:hypothetical protein